MPETKQPHDPSGLSHSEQSRRSFDKTVDEAAKAIEQTRAQIARSKALSQSEAAQSRDIDTMSEHHDRFLRDQTDRD